MNVSFIAAGPIQWGSSRMRAYWVAEAMNEEGHIAFVADYHSLKSGDELPPGNDAFIWQKSVNLDILKTAPKVNHYWDVCDPAWWWQPNECRDAARYMTAVVASSEALARDFNQWYGEELAVCIPDRLKLSHFHTQRQHTAVSPVRFIWFGVSVNRIALYAALANLERLVANGYKIELTIFDDRPDLPFRITNKFPIYHLQWELDKEVDILSSHDIALLPPYPGAWGEVKSDNKMVTASMCNLPVTKGLGYERMERMVDQPAFRNKLQTERKILGTTFLDDFNVKQSAIEWEALLNEASM